jgi:ribosome biogenesis GTPase A
MTYSIFEHSKQAFERFSYFMIGQGDPNMGKSSVINSVFGKKLVSSSATPGGCAAAPQPNLLLPQYFPCY